MLLQNNVFQYPDYNNFAHRSTFIVRMVCFYSSKMLMCCNSVTLRLLMSLL